MSDEGHQPGERSRLEAHGIQPRKRFGQNFLVDPRIPELTVDRAAWSAEAPVLEIGPGGGALTEALLRAGHRVEAIEKDRDLVSLLDDRFGAECAAGRFQVREGDALDLPWEFVTPVRDPVGTPRPWIAGNLPYAITTPLLLRAFEHRDRFDGAVFMLQREYGERLLATPGSKTYGSITVWTRAHAEVRSLLKVSRSAFWPRPGVESVVIELRFVDPPPYSGDRRALERVVRAGFGQRRKTLANALAAGLGREKPEIIAAIRRAEIEPEVRAETLGLAEFGRIVEALVSDG